MSQAAAVVVTAFENNTYHAMVHYVGIDCADVTVQVDARPSDALNLALRSGASVYVSKKVGNIDMGQGDARLVQASLMIDSLSEMVDDNLL